MKPSRLPEFRMTWCRWPLLLAALLIAGCDMLGIETAAQIAEQKDAEGRAIGSACRHALRSIEDCYRANPKASKSSVFAGWREMDQYMRENNIQGMPASDAPAPATAAPAAEGAKKAEEGPAAAGAAAPTKP